jgi:putative aldouronate transport system permease protein
MNVKNRIVTATLIVLLLGSLWMPFFTAYPYMTLPQDVIAAFPKDVTGLQLLVQGNQVFPVDLMPSLASIPFRQGLLAVSMGLAILGAILSLIRRRGVSHIAALLGCAGMLGTLLYAFYFTQLDSSVLFGVLLTSKWTLWLPFILSLALFGTEVWHIRDMQPMPLKDRHWRLVSAGLCLIALLSLLLPFAGTYVPDGTFATAGDDAQASRQITGVQWLAGDEPLLEELGATYDVFTNPSDGGTVQSLITLGDSGIAVRNLFLIPTHNSTSRGLAIAAVGILLLAFVLQLLRKVDRWIPASLIGVAWVMLMAEVLSMLTVDGSYQFMGATYQLMYLGLGGYTAAPLLLIAASGGAAVSAVLGIRRADSPYFVNPIPQRKRLLSVSLVLSVGATVLLLTPIIQVNLYTPGKINQANPTVSRSMTGLELASFSQPDELMNPQSNRGKALYGEAATKNGRTLTDLDALLADALIKMSCLTIAALLVAVGGISLLILRPQNKRFIVTVFLVGAVLQGATALTVSYLLPKDVGFASGLAPLYAAMVFSVFAAFFAGFLDYEELPKKFKLFLMMLPFLVAVILFSYLPLSGWRYAFYNYKLGLPMDQQEYVGFTWFTSLWSNAAQQGETIRVLRNTFAMSGLGLAASWLPVAFAIFLTEIKVGWFKKFVQIFTTLPNFISWVLVFSFALTIFSLDTGIINKALVGLGIISEPIAFLNSSEHIWVKMWLWNTWKTLGWGAIMYLAAIAGIDQELYEAAKVDGAGRWRQILHITIPGILPTFFVLLLLQISNIVNNGMEQYLVFMNAMNKSTIEVLDLYVYNISLGTRSTNTISMATAIGILKSLVSIVLLFLANNFSKAVRGESIV